MNDRNGLLDDLVDAMGEWQRAVARLEAASEGVEYDRGYFLANEYEAVAAAKKELDETLGNYIRGVLCGETGCIAERKVV